MKITLNELYISFGATEAFPESTKELFRNRNFEYSVDDEIGQANIRRSIESRILDGFSIVGQHRADIWESAWSEVKEKFLSSNCDPRALNPNFINNHKYVRWNGRFIKPDDQSLELSFFEVLRDWLFENYIKNAENIFEFGSGSGFNVVELANKFPKKNIVGLDWSSSAVDILETYRKIKGANVKGIKFDFFNPDFNIIVPPDSVFLTFCAFEQIGNKFQKMLDFFIEKRPKLVVQMEPTIELYDRENIFDQLAITYHENREYLSGYYTKLLEMDAAKQIKIIASRRLKFGSQFNECYTIHIWKPL